MNALLGILDEHCAKVGRDPKHVEASIKLGYSEFLLFPGQGDLRKAAEAAAKILPRMRDLT